MSDAVLLLFSSAITVVFTQGSIFRPLREHGPRLWRELVNCALCSGVWVGALSTVALRDIPLQWSFSVLFYVLGMGALTGCISVLFVVTWELFDMLYASLRALRTAFRVVQKAVPMAVQFAAELEKKQRETQ